MGKKNLSSIRTEKLELRNSFPERKLRRRTKMRQKIGRRKTRNEKTGEREKGVRVGINRGLKRDITK